MTRPSARVIPTDEAVVNRFWPKVRKADGDGCWEWAGVVNANGYGMLSLVVRGHRTSWVASRVSYTLNVGPIPDEMLVCHTCDNRRCVRPSHLFLGTDKDNLHDAIAKGRWRTDLMPRPIGSRVWASKLKEADVVEIRAAVAAGVTQRALARKYGVSFSAICLVVSGKTWASVPPAVLNYLEAKGE